MPVHCQNILREKKEEKTTDECVSMNYSLSFYTHFGKKQATNPATLKSREKRILRTVNEQGCAMEVIIWPSGEMEVVKALLFEIEPHYVVQSDLTLQILLLGSSEFWIIKSA